MSAIVSLSGGEFPLSVSGEEKLVHFTGAAGWVLDGTLQLPAHLTGKAPAVLLLQGSGPTDRDGNQRPKFIPNLLKQIAVELASHGIASLRFDKRNCPTHLERWPKGLRAVNVWGSWEHSLGDVRAAYLKLCSEPQIDSRRVALLGHSEGGMLASDVAVHLPVGQRPAALVLMATPGRTVRASDRVDLQANWKDEGRSANEIHVLLAEYDRISDAVSRDGVTPSDIPEALREEFPLDAGLWLRGFQEMDTSKTVRGYGGPVLVLQGAEDVQVSLTLDAPLLISSLKMRHSGTVDLVRIPHASHNFKDVRQDEEGIRGPVVRLALRSLTRWLERKLEGFHSGNESH